MGTAYELDFTSITTRDKKTFKPVYKKVLDEVGSDSVINKQFKRLEEKGLLDAMYEELRILKRIDEILDIAMRVTGLQEV